MLHTTYWLYICVRLHISSFNIIGMNRLGELLMRLRTELRNTPITSSYASSMVTGFTQMCSSSVGHFTSLVNHIAINNKIIYDVNDGTNFLSNCYRASFKLDEKEWPTVLHYFVAKKFDLKEYHVSEILFMKNCGDVHLYSRNSGFQSVSSHDTSK